jgi:hypothetical protein
MLKKLGANSDAVVAVFRILWLVGATRNLSPIRATHGL